MRCGEKFIEIQCYLFTAIGHHMFLAAANSGIDREMQCSCDPLIWVSMLLEWRSFSVWCWHGIELVLVKIFFHFVAPVLNLRLLFRTLLCIAGYIKNTLSSEQKKTDFKTDEADDHVLAGQTAVRIFDNFFSTDKLHSESTIIYSRAIKKNLRTWWGTLAVHAVTSVQIKGKASSVF